MTRTTATALPDRQYRAYVLGLFLLVNVFNYMDRMLVAALLEPIKRDLLLSDTQLGLLGGLAFALTYATVGIPIARWADRSVRRNIVAGAVLVWSLMTAACGAAQNYLQLFLARIGVGVGEAGGTPPVHSMITDLFPPHQRSMAMAIFTSGAAIGAFLGLAAGGWLSEAYGWRMAFVIMGLPGVLLALLVWMTVREPAREGMPPGSTRTDHRSAFRALWQVVPLRYVMIGGGALAFVSYGVNQWAPSYFIRQFGLDAATAGTWVGVAYGLGSALGLLAGGFLADRLTRRHSTGPSRVLIGASLIGAPLYAAAFMLNQAGVAVVFLFLASAVGSSATAPLMALAQQLAPPNSRATASAILMFFISVVGLGGASYFIGASSDALAPQFGVESLRYSLLLTTFALLPAAAIFAYCYRLLSIGATETAQR